MVPLLGMAINLPDIHLDWTCLCDNESKKENQDWIFFLENLGGFSP